MPRTPFLYYPVGKEELEQIRTEGLDARRRHFRRLKRARRHGGIVLVVKNGAERAGRFRPKDIRNLSPLRRAVRLLAGGGVLLRKRKGRIETVLIFRRGKWDIPKGKRDRGESRKACAIREVQEELGIHDVRLLWKIGVTTHAYRARKRRFVVKDTHWWAMYTDAEEFVPQASEQITDARWVPLDEAIGMVGYRGLNKLLKQARKQLASRSKVLSGAA